MVLTQVDKATRPMLPTAVINAHIGKRIRLGREAAHMRQLDLAVRIGVGYRTVCKYEAGAIQLSVEMLWKIAKALNQPVDYFYEGLRPSSLATVQ